MMTLYLIQIILFIALLIGLTPFMKTMIIELINIYKIGGVSILKLKITN